MGAKKSFIPFIAVQQEMKKLKNNGSTLHFQKKIFLKYVIILKIKF